MLLMISTDTSHTCEPIRPEVMIGLMGTHVYRLGLTSFSSRLISVELQSCCRCVAIIYTSCTSVHCRSARRCTPRTAAEQPHAKQTASKKLDLPLPFGPTIHVSPLLRTTCKWVLPTDLKALTLTLEMDQRDPCMSAGTVIRGPTCAETNSRLSYDTAATCYIQNVAMCLRWSLATCGRGLDNAGLVRSKACV